MNTPQVPLTNIKGEIVKPACIYPGSYATRVPIINAVQSLAANKNNYSSFYLDTQEGQSNDILNTEGDDHHQGLARTHKLSDGSVYFFLSHSELDSGDKGIIMQFRYAGPINGDHILQTSPLTIAPLKQLLYITEQHPADIEFLGDVNHADAGYLFVTEEYVLRTVAVYYWEPNHDLKWIGNIYKGSTTQHDPNFVFIDKVGDDYFLGIASNNTKKGTLYSAKYNELFPVCTKGNMNLDAFKEVSTFSFPVSNSPSQVKLVHDSTGAWFLLAYRSSDEGDPNSDDYIDIYNVHFNPFSISSSPISGTHIYLPHGDTSFTNTGTHYVESSGRLLVSSSYRWSEDESNTAGYVSRVDECPSNL